MTEPLTGTNLPPVQRRLLILAGYPGVGKSTLLGYCLRQRVPLFGAAHEQHFLRFKQPRTAREWELSPMEILENAYWFSESHIPFMKQMPGQIECALIHVDLLTLVTIKSFVTPTAPLSVRFPRTPESLARAEDNLGVLSNIFGSHFLGRWDSIAVNTYSLPYAVTCQRFQGRKQGLGPMTWLLKGGRQAQRIHASIHGAWRSCIASWKAAELYETSERDGKIVMKKMSRPMSGLRPTAGSWRGIQE